MDVCEYGAAFERGNGLARCSLFSGPALTRALSRKCFPKSAEPLEHEPGRRKRDADLK